MRLYMVMIEYSMPVLANSRDEAEKFATDHATVHEVVTSSGVPDSATCYEMLAEKYIPKEWRDAIPYGIENDDKTCVEAMEMCLQERRDEEAARRQMPLPLPPPPGTST